MGEQKSGWIGVLELWVFKIIMVNMEEKERTADELEGEIKSTGCVI